MARFRVFKTATYDEDYAGLDNAERLRVDSLVEQLFDQGDVTGKPLGVPFFREKKFGGKRLLYLVYHSVSAILLVGITGKKAQEATITEILMHLDEYKAYILAKLREIT